LGVLATDVVAVAPLDWAAILAEWLPIGTRHEWTTFLMVHGRDAFLYPTSHHALLPYQLVWQEAEVGKLDTSRN
jgi:hypothetical protein